MTSPNRNSPPFWDALEEPIEGLLRRSQNDGETYSNLAKLNSPWRISNNPDLKKAQVILLDKELLERGVSSNDAKR